jgi:glycosyltransferase involved in cell wall biosynthesis
VITHLALGGAEKVAFSIMRELRHEFDFAVFTVHGQSGDDVGQQMEDELTRAGIPWFRGTSVPNKFGGPLTGGWALNGAVQSFQADIVHCHAEPAEACAAVWASWFARRPLPVIRTVHNSMYWRFWPRVGRWCDRQLKDAAVACVSEAAREEFLRYRHASGVPFPPDPPAVIYNGVSLPVRPVRSGPRAAGVVRILFAGRFEPEKGPDLLCQAVTQVRLPADLRAELVLLGRGRLESSVEALCGQPPPGWTVNRRPPVADLPAVMTEFDLVVVPSRFEGLGLVAIEATLCGLPVVATDAHGLRETLPTTHPWLARANDPGDLAQKLEDALRQTNAWAQAVSEAQQFAIERFAPPRMADAYRQLYARLSAPALETP